MATSDDSDQVKKAALQLTDRILEWAQKPETTFATESAQKRALYDSIHQSARAWERPQSCIYQGCINQSIKRSHTIQRTGSLGLIAENGHLCRPKAYPDKGIVVERVGLAEASTFAGFCQTHEAMFATFETTGLIANDRDVLLQAFRSICREIVRRRFDIDVLTASRKALLDRITDLAKKEGAKHGSDVTSVSITGGPLALADERLATVRSVLADLEKLYADAFAELNGGDGSGSTLRAYNINLSVPVALSGFGMLNARGVNLPCVMGVVPQPGATVIYLVTQSGHEKLLDDNFAHIDLRPVLLDHIERWMIRGTDHWFIQPSVWNAIPLQRQQNLIEALADFSVGIEADVPYSIFDNLRRFIIADEEALGIPPAALAYFERQRRKLL